MAKYYVTAVTLAAVALTAYLQASIALHLFGAALVLDEAARFASGAHSVGAGAASALGASRVEKTAEAILSRNPFDSVTGSLIDELIESGKAIARVGPTDPLLAAGCDGVRVTMVTESADRLWSMVTVQIAGEPAPRLLHSGDDVSGKQVSYIGYNPKQRSPAVWLEANSSVCQALLFVGGPPPVATAPQPPPVTPRTTGVLADIASQIKKVSNTEFEADRAVVDKILKNQLLLMQSTHIVPEQKDGKVVGIRLFGMRPDTLLGILGLENGDRLESINGFDMASPQKMLEAYARLPAASRMTVRINRRGQPMSIDYRLK